MADRMIWLDLETTGLDPEKDSIIEIGIVVTDSNLFPVLKKVLSSDPLDVLAAYQSIVTPSQTGLERMNDFVRNMHEKSGLLHSLRNGLHPGRVEQEALAFVREHCERKEVPLCGSNIPFDRSFLAKQMPELNDWFHYRSIDVSSIKELAKLWYPKLPETPKKEVHRSLPDCQESIDLLKYYREYIFEHDVFQ